ncbi:MAG: lysophospholipid acyltransferase family protein [Fibrobacterota bacterium]
MVFAALSILSKLINIIPLPVLAVLAQGLGLLIYYCVPYRKWLILMQMEKALGTELDKKAIRALARKNYIHYASVFFESMILAAQRPEDPTYFNIHTSFQNREILDAALAEHKGVIIIGGHVGCWEAMGGMVGRFFAPVTVAVKLVNSPALQKFREHMQRQPGVTLIDSRMGRRRVVLLLNALRKGEMLGIFLDQYRTGEPFAPFFGHAARTNSTAALLHIKTGAPVVQLHCIRERLGFFRLELDAVDITGIDLTASDAVVRLNTVFNTSLEGAVRRHPDQWLWAHRRFKDNPDFQYN